MYPLRRCTSHGLDANDQRKPVILNERGAIILRQKLSRRQLETRLTTMVPCPIGMETCLGPHHLGPSTQGPRPRRTPRAGEPHSKTFVTRLQSRQLPSKAARQLPDLSTIIRVEPSSTGDPRLQGGALPITGVSMCSNAHSPNALTQSARRPAQGSTVVS